MKKTLLLTGMLLLVALFSAQAQEKTVTGKIIDPNGNPVPAATIVVSGTTTGTTADADGQFTLTAHVGDQLIISSIGFKNTTLTVPASNKSLTITLQSGAHSLDEMVVTALGIKKKKRSLGYSSQQVDGDVLADLKEPNLTNTLKGKVAGLKVVGGGSGITGSSKIVLRGYSSLTGDNQPLIVVDGVPYDNFTGKSNNDFWNPSLDMGNGLSDISAANIKSVTVLKGPSAAALYGSRAGNGVILITTKNGTKNKGIGINISSSIGFQTIFTHPEMQNVFGQGDLGAYKNNSNLSWGPKATGQQVTNWNGKKVPLKTYDNINNYFQTGIISNQHISFSQQYGETSIYTSYARMDDKGLDPSIKLHRNNFLTKISTNFGPSKKWTLNTKVQYINSTAHNRPQTGYARADMTFFTLYTLPRSLDITDFKTHVKDKYGEMAWYRGGDGSVYNPYWDALYNTNSDTRDRYVLHGSLQYDFTDWLNAKVSGATDRFATNTKAKVYAGSPADNSFSTGKRTFSETNFKALITAQKDNLFGKLGGSFSIGGNLMNRKNSSLSGNASPLDVPDLFILENQKGGKANISYKKSQKKINSVYGTLQIDYDDYLFLTGTFRNDWASSLSKANRSFMYPSISLSYIFTDMIKRTGGNIPSWISYGKFRASYAAVGNSLPPYQLYNTYNIGKDPFGNTSSWTNSTLFNPDVKSELIKSVEIGLNMRFLQNRLGLDFTYYKSNATDQLINLPMDPSSGYSSMKINAGNIQNEGIEVMLDAQIIKNPHGFNWDASLNFSSNKNTIKALYGDVSSYSLGGYDAISIKAVVGDEYGMIYGSKFKRVEDKNSPYNGALILDKGLPQATGSVVLGNQQPNAILGFTSNFFYRNFGLSISVDGSFGGKMFSSTLQRMEEVGTSALTVVNSKRDSILVTGVASDGHGGYVKNTKKVSPQQYWQEGISTGNTGITEANLYDASNIRIRNILLSYSLPNSVLSGTPFQKASIALSCNNVFMLSSHMHGLDPESSYATGTNAVGFESGSAPTLRTYHITINLGF